MDEDDLARRLGRLEADQKALIEGCASMAETMSDVKDILVELMDVVNTPPSGDLEAVLRQMTAGFDTLTEAVIALIETVSRQ